MALVTRIHGKNVFCRLEYVSLHFVVILHIVSCSLESSPLQYILGRFWHHCPFRRLVLALEFVAHLLKCNPLHALVFVDVLYYPATVLGKRTKKRPVSVSERSGRRRKNGHSPFVHQQHVWPAGHVWVDGHGEAEGVVLAVEVVEVVHPQPLNATRIDPAMRVGRFLDEHHGWQVIKVPISPQNVSISFL